MPSPSDAAPSGAGAYYEPAFDDNDAAIVQEAAQAQLALDEKKEIALETQAQNSVWSVFSNTYRASRIRTYRVRTMDGLEWIYTQPYAQTSGVQLPGEHSFILRGTAPQPVTVVPPDANWRRVKFVLSVSMTSFLFLFLYGAGLVIFGLFLLMFPIRARFRSTDPGFAKWVKTQLPITTAIRATKWGWLGLLGSGGWKLPWVVQLYSLGEGYSRLVIKAPDVGRHNLTRWRVGFAQAADIARAFQTILPPGSAAPKQDPVRV